MELLLALRWGGHDLGVQFHACRVYAALASALVPAQLRGADGSRRIAEALAKRINGRAEADFNRIQ